MDSPCQFSLYCKVITRSLFHSSSGPSLNYLPFKLDGTGKGLLLSWKCRNPVWRAEKIFPDSFPIQRKHVELLDIDVLAETRCLRTEPNTEYTVTSQRTRMSSFRQSTSPYIYLIRFSLQNKVTATPFFRKTKFVMEMEGLTFRIRRMQGNSGWKSNLLKH